MVSRSSYTVNISTFQRIRLFFCSFWPFIDDHLLHPSVWILSFMKDSLITYTLAPLARLITTVLRIVGVYLSDIANVILSGLKKAVGGLLSCLESALSPIRTVVRESLSKLLAHGWDLLVFAQYCSYSLYEAIRDLCFSGFEFLSLAEHSHCFRIGVTNMAIALFEFVHDAVLSVFKFAHFVFSAVLEFFLAVIRCSVLDPLLQFARNILLPLIKHYLLALKEITATVFSCCFRLIKNVVAYLLEYLASVFRYPFFVLRSCWAWVWNVCFDFLKFVGKAHEVREAWFHDDFADIMRPVTYVQVFMETE